MKRIEAMRALLAALPDRLAVCYAGAACEELYASGDDDRYLYVLGSMGLASSIGLGIAVAAGRPVLAFEGDASLLMNLGALVTIAQRAPAGYVLAIVDNGQNASTGGQPTPTATGLDLAAVARAAGCHHVFTCRTANEIRDAVRQIGAEMAVLRLVVEPGDGPRRLVDVDPHALRDRARAYLMR